MDGWNAPSPSLSLNSIIPWITKKIKMWFEHNFEDVKVRYKGGLFNCLGNENKIQYKGKF